MMSEAEQRRVSVGGSREGPRDIDHTARWIRRSRPGVAGIRLLCFPHAGGGASAFAGWQAEFPAGIEILPIQYPGRESRWTEPLCGDLAELVQALACDLAELWRGPCAFLGQSFGALVAFELARAILPRTGQPLRLFLSGARAPNLPLREAIRALPDAAFIEKLRDFDGIPDELLGNAELMELALPIIRSDFNALETHCFDAGDPLPVPISVFGGLHDNAVPVSDLLAWSTLTSKAFRSRFFAGDHFFLYRCVEAVAAHVATDLAASAAAPAVVNSLAGERHVE
jgi:medium-chain acyl-[acyl-carrier-protein] hydrolase